MQYTYFHLYQSFQLWHLENYAHFSWELYLIAILFQIYHNIIQILVSINFVIVTIEH